MLDKFNIYAGMAVGSVFMAASYEYGWSVVITTLWYFFAVAVFEILT